MEEKLPLRCNRCHGALMLTVAVPRDVRAAPYDTVAFACPYCGTRNEFSAAWTLIFVERAASGARKVH